MELQRSLVMILLKKWLFSLVDLRDTWKNISTKQRSVHPLLIFYESSQAEVFKMLNSRVLEKFKDAMDQEQSEQNDEEFITNKNDMAEKWSRPFIKSAAESLLPDKLKKL